MYQSKSNELKWGTEFPQTTGFVVAQKRGSGYAVLSHHSDSDGANNAAKSTMKAGVGNVSVHEVLPAADGMEICKSGNTYEWVSAK